MVLVWIWSGNLRGVQISDNLAEPEERTLPHVLIS